MKNRYFIQDFSLINALGDNKATIFENWCALNSPGMKPTDAFSPNKTCTIGHVTSHLPELPTSLARFDCRNNQLLLAAYQQISPMVEQAIKQFGAKRIGITLGTSTSGIASSEEALETYLNTGQRPHDYDFKKQEIGAGAEFLQQIAGIQGPALTVSTACSSSANAFASAKRLIDLDLCDAVIVGGADSLCQMTVQGFSALESVSTEPCQPFSKNRCGINIGEAVGLFLLSKQATEDSLEFYSVGCSSDAHHISAPEPSGKGAIAAINSALEQSPFIAEQVDYVNLHGTATKLNDAMESRAVNHVFGSNIACSSTKSLTGHTLGAAAATEIGLSCLLMSSLNPKHKVPAQRWDGERDEELPTLNIANDNTELPQLKLCLSNSFAFGGNNTAVLIGHRYESF